MEIKELLPIEGHKLPLSIYDRYCYYDPEYYDELLDYVEKVANEVHPNLPHPDGDFNYGYRIYGSRSICHFAVKYLDGKEIDTSFKQKFIDNKDVQNTINGFGIDVDKFWYLLLFINDYSYHSCNEGCRFKDSPEEQIKKLVSKIVYSIKEFNKDLVEVTFNKPIEIDLKINGQRVTTIDDPLAVLKVAQDCLDGLKRIEEGAALKMRRGYSSIAESNSVHIWYFAKLFLTFFDLYPQFSGRKKHDPTVSLDKKLLISRLIYIVGLSKNEKFVDSNETLNGYLRQYKNYTEPVVSITYI
jgi:hypothetical protein